MNKMQRATRRLDAFQQRHVVPGFIVGVMKKFGDDNAGALTVQLTYTMFVTVFPLLLLLITILGIVLSGDPSARDRVLQSTFGEFPIVGQQLAHNIQGLKRSSDFGLIIGIVGIIYGTTGLAQTGLYAMEQVWNVPATTRPSFVVRLVRSLIFLAVLSVGLIVTTLLSGFGTFGRHNFALGLAAEGLAGVVNIGIYLGAFRVLTPKQVHTRCLLYGSIFTGILWTVLQAVGGYVVGHDLKGASATYGMFGLVLGLVAWIYLGAQVTLYGAELNTVLERRLWPRAMVQPPLTLADQESLALQTLQTQRRPEQEITTHFRQRPMTEDEYRDHHFELEDQDSSTSRKTP